MIQSSQQQPLRLVVLSSRRFQGAINDPIHRGFFDAFPGEVIWVGPGERVAPKRELAVQIDRLRPDIVLVNMKKRTVDWVETEQIARIPMPKAVVEVDYCYETSDVWYQAAQFDVVFMRGKSDLLRTALPHARWLPFSVSTSWLCSREEMNGRPHGVGFAGTVEPVHNYPARVRALEVLKAAGIKAMPRGKVRGEDYMTWWRTTEIGLTCSSAFRYENAKHVIIPAAGALLLTDGSPGLPELLPADAYALYRPDGDDVLDVVAQLLKDRTALLARRQAARDAVEEQHTHTRRWQQVLAEFNLDRRASWPRAKQEHSAASPSTG